MTGDPVLDNPRPSNADQLRDNDRDGCDHRDATVVGPTRVGAQQDNAMGGEPVEFTVQRIFASVRPRLPLLARAIAACQECAQAATVCADACLSEEAVDERTVCVRALLDAADVAATTARVLSRTGTDRAMRRALLATCWSAARVAREACEELQPIRHRCAATAQACRVAEHACRELLEQTL